MMTTWRKRAAAALAIGLCVAQPLSAQPLTDAEVKRLIKRAEEGHVPAMTVLGRMYLSRTDPRHNETEGFRWMKAAADKGDGDAAMRYALGPDDGKFDTEYLRKAADLGVVFAMTALGVHYQNQEGEPDYRQAAQFYRQAADRGSADGAYHLAELHRMGLGVRADAVEADRLLRIAAALGNEDAQARLEDPTLQGKATPEDAAAARARADQVLAASKAKGFVNASVGARARVRHEASGLTCEFGTDVSEARVEEDRDGALCGEPGVETRARPAASGLTADDVLRAWAAQVQKKERRKPAESPIPDSPGSRFPEAWLGNDETYLRLSVGVVDGWVFSERINARAETWRTGAGGGRAYAPLNRAAPLPRERPAIKVLDKPKSFKALDNGPPPNGEMVARLIASCRPEGAFAERFGATTVSGVGAPRIANSWEVTPSPAIPGVHHVEAVVTNTSGKIHSLNAWSPTFKDKAALAHMILTGRAEAVRQGWTQTEGSEEDDNFVFARKGSDGQPALELEVGEVLGSLVITCREPTLYALTWREFTGNEVPKTRPVPPVVPPGPPHLWISDCADSGLRRVILKAVFDESKVRMGLGSQWDRYYEALMHWKLGVLTEKAKLTKAQASDLGLRAAFGGMERGFEANINSFMRGIEGLTDMSDALDAGDELGACQEATIWLDATEDIVKGNRSQWKQTHVLLDAEAKKRGISFD